MDKPSLKRSVFVIILVTLLIISIIYSDIIQIKRRKVGNQFAKQSLAEILHNSTSSSCCSFNLSQESKNSSLSDYFVVVISGPGNFDRRNAVRSTWLSSKWRTTFRVTYRFLLGDSGNSFKSALDSETSKFGDIVIVPWFTDSYLNLTYKTIAMLQLAQELQKLVKFKYLLKADDDTFVNFITLNETVQQCESSNPNNGFILGKVSSNTHPDRNPASKYFVSHSEYASDGYPPFVHGPAYLMTFSAVQLLSNSSVKVPFVHLEDIYVALLAKAVGLKLIDHGGFLIWQAKSWKELRQLRSAHYMTPNLMYQVWNEYLAQ